MVSNWNEVDKPYRALVRRVFEKGKIKTDRTGTGTRSLFNEEIKIDLRNCGFCSIATQSMSPAAVNQFWTYLPMITTKKMFWKNVPTEFCWIWNGLTNIDFLKKYDCNIWDAWADENGDLGPVYGYQLRYFGARQGVNEGLGIDQLRNIINLLQRNPESRRIMANYWNPADLPDMKLEPCHYGFQCEVHKENGEEYLNLKFNMRSVDVFLGLPQDILLYSLMLFMLCTVTRYKPGWLIGTFGDTHIYSNHLTQVRDYLYDDDFQEEYDCPAIIIDLSNDDGSAIDILTELTPERIIIDEDYNYQSNRYLKAPIAV